MYYVYALISEDSAKIYIGHTNELKRRLSEHNDSSKRGSLYTKRNKGPWRLFYNEEFSTRPEAMRREKALKSQKGREFLRGILRGESSDLW